MTSSAPATTSRGGAASARSHISNRSGRTLSRSAKGFSPPTSRQASRRASGCGSARSIPRYSIRRAGWVRASPSERDQERRKGNQHDDDAKLAHRTQHRPGYRPCVHFGSSLLSRAHGKQPAPTVEASAKVVKRNSRRAYELLVASHRRPEATGVAGDLRGTKFGAGAYFSTSWSRSCG